MEETTTPYSNRCAILGVVWLEYKDDEQFMDFIDYNDLGLPLAYLISEDIVKSTPLAETFINETWELFLAGLDLKDTGFESLDQILGM